MGQVVAAGAEVGEHHGGGADHHTQPTGADRTRADRGRGRIDRAARHHHPGAQAEVLGRGGGQLTTRLTEGHETGQAGAQLVGGQAAAGEQLVVVAQLTPGAVVGEQQRERRVLRGRHHTGEPSQQMVDRLHERRGRGPHLRPLAAHEGHLADAVAPTGGDAVAVDPGHQRIEARCVVPLPARMVGRAAAIHPHHHRGDRLAPGVDGDERHVLRRHRHQVYRCRATGRGHHLTGVAPDRRPPRRRVLLGGAIRAVRRRERRSCTGHHPAPLVDDGDLHPGGAEIDRQHPRSHGASQAVPVRRCQRRRDRPSRSVSRRAARRSR